MFSSFSGYRTYIIAVASIVYAAFGFFFQNLPGDTALQIVQVALIGLGLRSAIK